MQDDRQNVGNPVNRRREFADQVSDSTFEAHSLETGVETESVPVSQPDKLDIVSFDPAPEKAPMASTIIQPTEPKYTPEIENPLESETSDVASTDETRDDLPHEEESSSASDTERISPMTERSENNLTAEEQTKAQLEVTETTPVAAPEVSKEGQPQEPAHTRAAETSKDFFATNNEQIKPVDDEHLLAAHNVTPHHFALGKILIPLLAILIGGVLAFGAYKFITTSRHNSQVNNTFEQALANTFSTKSFTKQVVYNQANYTESNYDVSDVRKPKMSAKTFVTAGGVSGFGAEGYSTLENGYVKFSVTNPSDAQKQFADKWIQVRKDGKIPLDVDTNVLELYDVRFTPFGLASLGNFSASEQKQLTEYVEKNKVFIYDNSAVKTQRSNAENLYMYPVTAQASRVASLSKKIADIVGYGLAPNIANSKANFKANIWVNSDTKRIVQIETTKNGQPITYNFYNFDKTTLPSEPTAELGWSDYMSKAKTN